MDILDRSTEIHHKADAVVWLTTGDETDSVSHTSAQCPEFAKAVAAGRPLATEAEPTGWVCPYCTDVLATHHSQALSTGAYSVDAPEQGGAGGGHRADGASDKQKELIASLAAELGLDRVPAVSGKRDASELIDGLMERVKELRATKEAATDVPADAEVHAFLTGLGRKAEPGDITDGLKLWATGWAKAYTGSFEFMVDMRADANKGTLSVGKAKGVLNCAAAAIRRGDADAPQGVAVVAAAAPAADAGPAGHEPKPGTYTLVRADGSYRTLQFAHAKWADGKLVAAYLSGADNTADYTTFAFVDGGRIGVFGRFKGESALVDDLRTFLALGSHDDAHEEFLRQAEAYALESGGCMRCGRELTVPASLHRGLGPKCAVIEGVA